MVDLSKAISHERYTSYGLGYNKWLIKLTHEEFTGEIFNDLDPSGTRISRLSEFSFVNSTEIALNIPHKAHIL